MVKQGHPAESYLRVYPAPTYVRVLHCLWSEDGPLPARRIQELLAENGHRVSYTSLATQLERLRARGWVLGLAGPNRTSTILWSPAQSKEEFFASVWRELVESFACGDPEALRLMGEEIDRLRIK